MGLTTSEGASALESTAVTHTASEKNTGLPVDGQKSLPDKPLITIERSGSWTRLNLGELWAYRELLYFLTWRDVKVRYKQTLLGVLWVIIQPLLMILIFTLFFGRLAGLDQKTGGIPYPIFAFAGLLPWTFFASALTSSSTSLVASAHLITKIYFPRMIVPAAAVAACLVDFAVAFVVLAGMMIYYGVAITSGLLLLPALVLVLTALALAIGMLMAALNVRYRDIRHALPFIVQIWMFASPVIYPTTIIPDKWKWMLALNPMTGIIEGFRAALLGQSQIDWNVLAISAAVTLVLLVSSLFMFRRMEKSFADII